MKFRSTFKTFEEWSTEAPLTGADWSFLPEEVVQTLIPNFLTNTPAVGGRLTVEDSEEMEECIRECESLQEDSSQFIIEAAKEPYRIFSEFLSSKGEGDHLKECKSIWECNEVNKVIGIIKESVKRSRPYWKDDRIKVAEGTEKFCYSFPSGHAAGTRLIALKMADKFPKYKNDLIKLSDQIARSRVQAGIHYPSDIKAGKALGECFYELGY
jgi:hypothetical protein